jgi:hypothetical protein
VVEEDPSDICKKPRIPQVIDVKLSRFIIRKSALRSHHDVVSNF